VTVQAKDLTSVAAHMEKNGALAPYQVVVPQGLSFDHPPQGWNVRWLPRAKKRTRNPILSHKRFGKK